MPFSLLDIEPINGYGQNFRSLHDLQQLLVNDETDFNRFQAAGVTLVSV